MSDTRMTRRSLSDRRIGQTDWTRVDRQTDREIEEQIASDQDAAPLVTAEWLAWLNWCAPKCVSLRRG